jgi:hypothetical protein
MGVAASSQKAIQAVLDKHLPEAGIPLKDKDMGKRTNTDISPSIQLALDPHASHEMVRGSRSAINGYKAADGQSTCVDVMEIHAIMAANWWEVHQMPGSG